MKQKLFFLSLILVGLSCSKSANPSGKNRSLVNPSSNAKNLLFISSSPSKVEVTLNGKKRGYTPLTLFSLDHTKTHILLFEKKFYRPKKISLLPEEWTYNRWRKAWQLRREFTLTKKALFQSALLSRPSLEKVKKTYRIVKLLGRGVVRSMALDPREKRLAVGTANRLLLLDSETGKELKSLGLFMDHRQLAFSPSGKVIASLCRAEDANYLAIFQIKNNRLLLLHKFTSFSPGRLSFSPQGNQLALGGKGGVMIWKKEKKSWQKKRFLSISSVEDLQFSKRGYTLGVVSSGRLFFYGEEEKPRRLSFFKHIRRVIFHQDEKFFLLLDGEIVYTNEDGQTLWSHTLPFGVSSRSVVDFSLAQKKYLVILIKNRAFRACVFDTQQEKFVWMGAPYSGKIQGTFLSVDGRYLGVDLTNRIGLMDLAKMELIRMELVHGRRWEGKGLYYFPGKKQLVEIARGRIYEWGFHRGRARRWKLPKARYILPLEGNRILFLQQKRLGIFHWLKGRVEESFPLAFSGKNSLFCATADGLTVAGIWGNTLRIGRKKTKGYSFFFHKKIAEPAQKLVFDLRGTKLAVVGQKKISLLSLPSGKSFSISSPFKKLGAIAFSPSGYFIALAEKDRGKLEIFSIKKKKSILRVSALPFAVAQVVFMPDERYILAVTHNRESMAVVKINISNGAWEDIFLPLAKNLSDFTPLAGGFRFRENQLFLAFADGTLRAFHTGHFFEKYSLFFGGKYNRLAYKGDGSVLEAQRGSRKIFWKGKNVYIFSKAIFSPSEKLIVFGDYTGKKLITSKLGSQAQRTLLQLQSPITHLYPSRKGKFIGVASEDGQLKILEMPSGKVVKTLFPGSLTRLDFSWQNQFFAYGTPRPSLEVRRVFSPLKINLEVFNLPKYFAFLKKDLLLFSDGGKQLILWDVGLNTVVKRFLSVEGELFFPSPKGGEFLYKASAKKIYIHSPRGTVRELAFPNLLSGAFSPDGKVLALANSQGVFLYHKNTLQQIGSFFYRRNTPPLSLAFSPGGTTLAVAYSDGVIVIWKI